MSQWFLSDSLCCCCFISAYSFHNYLSLYGSWQKKQAFSRHQSASHLLVLRPTAIKSNAKQSRFRLNWKLTGTIYHWSVILGSFSVVLNSTKRNANRFFKVLLLSSHLLISRHLVQNSMFGACTVMGYLSLIHIWRCRRIERCRSRWSPYH